MQIEKKNFPLVGLNLRFNSTTALGKFVLKVTEWCRLLQLSGLWGLSMLHLSFYNTLPLFMGDLMASPLHQPAVIWHTCTHTQSANTHAHACGSIQNSQRVINAGIHSCVCVCTGTPVKTQWLIFYHVSCLHRDRRGRDTQLTRRGTHGWSAPTKRLSWSGMLHWPM